MRDLVVKYVLLLFLVFSINSFAADEYCSVYIVESRDAAEGEPLFLEEPDYLMVQELAKELAAFHIAEIYTADDAQTFQVAEILGQYHECNIILDGSLGKLLPNTFSERISHFKLLVKTVFEKNKGKVVVLCVSESLFHFLCGKMHKRYVSLPCFSYAKLSGNRDELQFSYSNRPEKIFHLKRAKK